MTCNSHRFRFRLIVLLITALMSCSYSPQEEEFASGPADLPNQEGWDSEVIITRDGIVQMKLKYRHMMRWDNKNLTTFRSGFRADLYEKGAHSAWLTADSGEIRHNNLLAFGSVVVTSDSGLSLNSTNLRWDDFKKRVFADGLVCITTQEDTLYGYDFESDQELNNWKLKRAYGQSSRDVDIRTGTIRSRKQKDQSGDLDREVENILKNETP